MGTVFYRKVFGKGENRTTVNLTINIDWLLLSRQKLELLRKIWEEGESKLWGLVELLDFIQDQAEGQGHPVIWFRDDEELAEGEPLMEEGEEIVARQ